MKQNQEFTADELNTLEDILVAHGYQVRKPQQKIDFSEDIKILQAEGLLPKEPTNK